MTSEMRERVMKNIEASNGALTVERCKEIIAQKERVIAYWNSLPAWEQGYSCRNHIANAQADIEYFQAVIELLTEMAVVEVANEAVAVVVALVKVMPRATAIRKAVALVANKLHKLRFSLSDSFKKAWGLIKAFNGLIPSLT